jgi:hypothetical protein
MMELQVVLDFDCCSCAGTVGVTLKCEGKGLASDDGRVAAVRVPCPACSTINQLYFEPSGVIRAVLPVTLSRQIPEPSLN